MIQSCRIMLAPNMAFNMAAAACAEEKKKGLRCWSHIAGWSEAHIGSYIGSHVAGLQWSYAASMELCCWL